MGTKNGTLRSAKRSAKTVQSVKKLEQEGVAI
jgi:hypothetical protein